MFFFFLHIFFIHMLDGHILYMFSWIVLYVSCTKINVKHLSMKIKTKNSVQSSKQLGLQTAHTMEGKHTLKYTHRLRSNAMEDKQKRPIYTSVCVSIWVCTQMKSCLWSFCTESMKQAWLLNRVFIHFGLWWWDQRTVKKNYKQTRGDLVVHMCVFALVCVCSCVCIDGSAKNKVGERERGQREGVHVRVPPHFFVCVLTLCAYVDSHMFVCVCVNVFVCASSPPPAPSLGIGLEWSKHPPVIITLWRFQNPKGIWNQKDSGIKRIWEPVDYGSKSIPEPKQF